MGTRKWELGKKKAYYCMYCLNKVSYGLKNWHNIIIQQTKTMQNYFTGTGLYI